MPKDIHRIIYKIYFFLCISFFLLFFRCEAAKIIKKKIYFRY